MLLETQRESGRRSARRVVPLVLELIHPRSVVDVGCGVGTWLSVFREHGVEDVRGIDIEGVAGLLEIPLDQFLAHDLTRPIEPDRQFDLVVCLEVAEHLPPDGRGHPHRVPGPTRSGDPLLGGHSAPGRDPSRERTVARVLGGALCHLRLCRCRCDSPWDLG